MIMVTMIQPFSPLLLLPSPHFPCFATLRSLRTYVAAIHATGRAGQWEHAVSLFRRMLSDGLVPTDQAWTAVISACKVGIATAEESLPNREGRGDESKRVRAVMVLLTRARAEGEGGVQEAAGGVGG